MTKNAKAQNEPTGFTGAELVLVGPAVALVKHAYDAWKEGRPAVSASDPLTFGIADSVTGPSGHTLALVCTNLGAHGVYIEDVTISEPSDVEVTARVPKREAALISFDYPHESAPPALLPILVSSSSSVILVVAISPFSTVRMKKKPYGKINIWYTVLGVASTGLKHEVEFSVRPAI